MTRTKAFKATGPVGMIFDVKRFAVHDGPGLRTTVFFKGCPLRCAWCQNPEGIPSYRQVFFWPRLCIRCGWCADPTRPGHPLHPGTKGASPLPDAECLISQCPARALEVVGRPADVEQVMRLVRPDRPFYDRSGGGLTLSGGEPLLQPAFARAVLAQAKAEGFHTALDTSGYAPWTVIEPLLEYVDIFLYDLKDTDEKRHRKNTGGELGLVLENLKRLDRAGAVLQLRCPLIPGINDTAEHKKRVHQINASLSQPYGLEFIPYHELGQGKRQALGILATEL